MNDNYAEGARVKYRDPSALLFETRGRIEALHHDHESGRTLYGVRLDDGRMEWATADQVRPDIRPLWFCP